MTLLAAAIIDGVSTDADALRRVYKLLAVGQQGIGLAEGDLKVTTSGGMVSVIAAGDALANGTQNSVTQGSYGLKNDANVSQTHSTSDPTNPRNDLVVVQIRDAFYSGANKDAIAAIVTGVAAPSPVDPSAPANSVILARVRVNAGASTLGTITDLRPRLGSPYHAEVYLGGTQVVANNTLSQVAFDSVESDPNSNFTTGVSAHYTCPVAGRYLVTAEILWNTTTTTTTAMLISLYRNGSEARRGQQGGQGAYTLTNIGTPLSAVVRCSATDTLDVRGQQVSGGGNTLLTGPVNTYAQFTYLGPN